MVKINGKNPRPILSLGESKRTAPPENQLKNQLKYLKYKVTKQESSL